jgi:hypothetical protein
MRRRRRDYPCDVISEVDVAVRMAMFWVFTPYRVGVSTRENNNVFLLCLAASALEFFTV